LTAWLGRRPGSERCWLYACLSRDVASATLVLNPSIVERGLDVAAAESSLKFPRAGGMAKWVTSSEPMKIAYINGSKDLRIERFLVTVMATFSP